MSTQLTPGVPFHGLIQVAGVFDLEEANMLARCGVHVVGIPLRLPVNTPDLSEEQAKELIRRLPEMLTPVLITYETDAQRLLDLIDFLNVPVLQMHADPPGVDLFERVKRFMPHLYIIKSLVIRPETAVDDLKRRVDAYSEHVDAFITDTFDPSTGATGATGKPHDWEVSRALVEYSSLPVIHAGGLTPKNVGQAIHSVAPAGVDAHTGLEGVDGRKDETLVKEFVKEATEAFKEKRRP